MRTLIAIALAGCGTKPAPRDEAGSARLPPPAPVVVIDAAAPDAKAELPAVAVEVPTKPAALQTWLVAGHYKAWTHESKRHESDGPHGDAVRSFVSPSLLASLQQGGAHPVGASAVKELYDERGKHTGWAVSVKTAADSAGGKGWYWYEVFSTAAGAKPAYEGVGEKLCRECHTEGGIDQVLLPFPLL